MNNLVIAYLGLGLLAGVLSGIVGIGGGIIIIPALVFLFGFSQHMAQGTTLALLVPPVGILAAWMYYRQGYVNLNAALFICLGFFIGGFFGGLLGSHLPALLLRRIFGAGLLLLSLKMILGK